MRVGLCGAQGVGKTTLAKELSTRLRIPRIEEQARIAAHEIGADRLSMLKKDPELGIEFQNLCLNKQINSEFQAGSSFVSCRTTIDNVLYWMKWHAHNAGSLRTNEYYGKCSAHVKNYDLIVYVPPEFDIEDDGFRSINKEYQREMDMLVQMLLAYYSPRAMITVHGNVEARVRRVIQELNCIGYYVPMPYYNI